MRLFPALFILLFLLGCAPHPTSSSAFASTPTATLMPSLDWLQVAKDGSSFVKASSGQRFIAWGFNYDHIVENRMLEDYWESDWGTVEKDFQEMKLLGANAVRIHLQLNKFMMSATQANGKALNQLSRLIALAENVGLYLDLTGLGAYRKADVPSWYDALSEMERWDVQARFWSAISARGAASPAVFFYDLMNEPVVAAGRVSSGDWYDGEFGGFHFIQFITLDPAGRSRDEIARQWIRKMTGAIRQNDRHHLITVGLLPPNPELGGIWSGFVPAKVAPELDFISLHIYPQPGKISDGVETLKQFSVSKPLIVEETSNLYCSAPELEQFILQSRGFASGWFGFYWGKTPEQLRQSKEIRDAISLGWLDLFVKLEPVIMR